MQVHMVLSPLFFSFLFSQTGFLPCVCHVLILQNSSYGKWHVSMSGPRLPLLCIPVMFHLFDFTVLLTPIISFALNSAMQLYNNITDIYSQFIPKNAGGSYRSYAVQLSRVESDPTV